MIFIYFVYLRGFKNNNIVYLWVWKIEFFVGLFYLLRIIENGNIIDSGFNIEMF